MLRGFVLTSALSVSLCAGAVFAQTSEPRPIQNTPGPALPAQVPLGQDTKGQGIGQAPHEVGGLGTPKQGQLGLGQTAQPAPRQPGLGQPGTAQPGTGQPQPGGVPLGTPPVNLNNLPAGINQPLFFDPNVRRTLSITEQQFGRLSDTFNQNLTRFQDEFNQLRTLNEQDRLARIAALNRSFNDALMRGSQDIFTQQQLARLQQLQFQARGLDVFNDAGLQQQMNLTQAQLNDLRGLNDDFNRQLAILSQTARTNRDGALQQFGMLQAQLQQRLNTVLTEPQQRAFNQLRGDPFTFLPPAFAQNPATNTGVAPNPQLPGGTGTTNPGTTPAPGTPR